MKYIKSSFCPADYQKIYVTYRLHFETDVLHYVHRCLDSPKGSTMNMPASHEIETDTDTLVRYSRRVLWTLLFLFLLFGAAAFIVLGSPHSFSRGAWQLPISIFIIVLAGLGAAPSGARRNRSALNALQNDELRQHSLQRAFRNGFFAVLLAQPLLALAPLWIEISYPVPLMACLTLVTGVLVTTASLLYYDR